MLYNNIHSQFAFTRDDNGVPVFNDVEYNVKVPKIFKGLSFDQPNNMFVGNNEIMVTETFNRPLKEIFDMQTAMLDICQDKYIDIYPKKDKLLDISKNEYI